MNKIKIAIGLSTILFVSACANFGRSPATKGWTAMTLCPHDGYPTIPTDSLLLKATAQHVYGGKVDQYECQNPAAHHDFVLTNWYVLPIKAIKPYQP